jgi:hypothetical protein
MATIPDFAAITGAQSEKAPPLSTAEHLQAAVAYSHMMTPGASPAEAIILGQAAARHLAAGQIDAARN